MFCMVSNCGFQCLFTFCPICGCVWLEMFVVTAACFFVLFSETCFPHRGYPIEISRYVMETVRQMRSF